MILSRWPIIAVDEDRQPSTRSYAISFGIGAKVFSNDKMSVVIDVMGTPLRIGALHFDWRLWRPGLLDRYMTWFDRFTEARILAGDTNMGVDSFHFDPLYIFASARARYGVFPTVDTDCPELPDLDWIMVRKGTGVSLGEGAQVCSGYMPSAHSLVYATVVVSPVAHYQFVVSLTRDGPGADEQRQ